MPTAVRDAFPATVDIGQTGLSSYSDITAGSWRTEAASAAALDDTLQQAGLWRVEREVRGTLVQPRPGQVDKSMRIDRVLIPTARLLDMRWPHGIIGVEIKRSGEKVGPPIAQALDYGRSVWSLHGGFQVWLDYVFIWPMAKTFGGALESICAQHRIGFAYPTDWSALRMQCGAFNIIDVARKGDVRLGTAYALPRMGKGAGRR